MGKKAEKDFTHMKTATKNTSRTFALLALLCLPFLTGSCGKNKTDTSELIPNVPVGVIINLDLPAYFPLTQLGAYLYYDGGARGLLIYHGFDDAYYCFDRNCPYQPLNDCSQILVDDDRLYARCGSLDGNQAFTECCASRFELSSGFPVAGPAQRALKQYFINRQGNTLYINN
jgi:nitrite reductase/ring-hydroxylating ferredoxin subunit